MCARRFLILIFILTLIVVARRVRDLPVRRAGADPDGDAQGPLSSRRRRASGPDYADSANWIARPGLADDPSHWLPDRRRQRRSRERRAATFFIHPTTYLERDRWNAPLDDRRQASDRADLFVRSQASAFNAVADVWAPRYRQAAFGAFLLNSEDATKALDLAYRDVARGVRRLPRRAARRQRRSSSPATARARCTCRGCCAKGRRQAAREADRRGLCRRLAAVGDRRLAGDGPARLPRRRRGRLHPVVAELRRARQPRAGDRRL